ncbi:MULTISPECIES: XRE family transcriptional regulator [Streptomyces]|uniref:XRE family transcriptional regulator n=1 Tax=Streptomyces TaxID=1883 RepID=UPI0019CF6A8F|nr:XRE family transcriptional regulator [Streptomyces thermoviolaceus]WTD49080.1 XRE family transcriptional regulator [Streptomyces thermoviolaceus]
MATTRNAALAAFLTEHQMTASELADAVNHAISDLTGRQGATSERTVFRWLSGESRWPQERQRRALEAVTGRSITALGFVPRGKRTSVSASPAEESKVLRREFCGAATHAAAAVAVPFLAAPSRVGTADIIRLREHGERLVALDADRGGHGTLAQAALAGAAEALTLQRQSTTQRVRQRLLALASDFTATAAWSSIDAGQLDVASRHLDRALTLAGLAQDSDMTMQVWNLRAMLARQRKEYGEAVAASQAMLTTAGARRSPLHASLAYARTAVGFAYRGDRHEALRCLGRAETLLEKADLAQPRAPWIAFYGPAELHCLSAIVRDQTGDPAEAEAAYHQALTALPTTYRRNRAYTTACLALSQLHQGDVEQACATSGDVFAIMAGHPLPGRMRRLLGDFQRDLITRAPTARIAHEWTDRYRTEWSPHEHGCR